MTKTNTAVKYTIKQVHQKVVASGLINATVALGTDAIYVHQTRCAAFHVIKALNEAGYKITKAA